ncbi:hypothetical protein [Nonomuraea sp. NPDC023979]|uniref:hypothetical protein n=1 Tax=Nonomuraea sp. NPDC023979 TaxID=3154796 RepID=UPI0033DB9EAB
MITKAALRGYLLEEVLAWMLRNSGYRLLVDVSQDPYELVMNANGLCVKGRGADHQVDVLGEFAFVPAFSLPIRLFLEAKFTRHKTDLAVVRNAHGVIHDINENFVHGPGNKLRKRCRYVYAVFSASGFTTAAQDFALAQQISLVDLSGASFTWLLSSIESTAEKLLVIAEKYKMKKFPVMWMRSRLRSMLGTMPDISRDDEYYATNAFEVAEEVEGSLGGLVHALMERRRVELLLGFPAAPFILPLAVDNIEQFLDYARNHPDHIIRLWRTGEDSRAEWAVSPMPQEWTLGFSAPSATYRLTFNLPKRFETWISENEENRVSRVRAVKAQFLSEIVIHRIEGDGLRAFQLRYQPEDLHRDYGW